MKKRRIYTIPNFFLAGYLLVCILFMINLVDIEEGEKGWLAFFLTMYVIGLPFTLAMTLVGSGWQSLLGQEMPKAVAIVTVIVSGALQYYLIGVLLARIVSYFRKSRQPEK